MTERRTGRNADVDSPFTVPINNQLFGYYQSYKSRRHHNSRPRIARRTVNKIHPVTEENEAISAVGPMAITDIDSGYFTDLVGRPVREKFSRSQYVNRIQNILRTKLLTGYKRDDCSRINQQFTEEKKRLKNIEQQYQQYNSAFEEYLSIDHEASMMILDKAREEVEKTNTLKRERDDLLNKFGQARLGVFQWEKKWHAVRMCHEFLQTITSTSPQFNQKKLRFSEKDKANNKQDYMQDTLESIIEAFERDINDGQLSSQDISLKDPLELSQIFVTMEQRNLNALIHLESLSGPITEMTTSIAVVKELIGSEIEMIEQSFNELESLIYVTEERENQLESYADYLLHQVFHDLVCSDSVLHLRVFIEDTYESCAGPNDANLDSYSMMHVIEKTYESLNMSLDDLPRDIVRDCEKKGFTQEMRTMREAEDAARKFNLMHRLLAALERIMKTPGYDSELKSEAIARDSKIKFMLPVQNSIDTVERSNRHESDVIVRKHKPRIYGNYRVADLNIFDELTVASQASITREILTKISQCDVNNDEERDEGEKEEEDCRDEISQMS